MSKDPATLWYWNDWLTGTMTMSRHLKGCYMDLLGAQFNEGHLSLEAIKTVLGNDFAVWGVLSKKFIKDENDMWYNIKAEETKNKRIAFTKSRKNNLKGKKEVIMESHMENENITTSIYFKIKGQIVKTNVSDYIKTNLQIWLDNQKRLDTVDVVEKGLIEIDKQYFAHSFADENHIKSSLKLICKKIKEGNKTDSKQSVVKW